MPVTNINDNLITRIVPEFYDEVAAIRFVNEAGFEEWFNNIAQKHANWNLHQSWTNKKKAKPFLGQPLVAPLRLHTIKYQCDHAGKLKKRKKASKHLLTDSAVEVKYRWEDSDHNLCDVQEIISSRLPSEVKQWIEELKDNSEGLNDLASALRQSISIIENICSVPQPRPARQQ
ncbi:hypothetical protein RMATCC62417_04711 [Rhizopus microsporus]|nr:hypothetical protein RMATCC62417_04711 [Rhizopus microsporus]